MSLEEATINAMQKEYESWSWFRKLMNFFDPEFIIIDHEKVVRDYLIKTSPKLVEAFDFNTFESKMIPNPLIERLLKEQEEL